MHSLHTVLPWEKDVINYSGFISANASWNFVLLEWAGGHAYGEVGGDFVYKERAVLLLACYLVQSCSHEFAISCLDTKQNPNTSPEQNKLSYCQEFPCGKKKLRRHATSNLVQHLQSHPKCALSFK